MFKKILIANRGEIALRVIRTCKEMGIKTVAVYSTADRNSLPVRFADEAICIGPPQSSQSYLDIPSLIAACEITNADALHPGYGFLSENARFSEICHLHGIKFIGSGPEMIRKMGNKSVARETMKNAGVPIVPGSDGILESAHEAKKLATEIGYPIMLKASAGGGGKGMRIVNNESELDHAWESASKEAASSFGDDSIYLEKFVVEPRHIEIQVIGDQYGTVCHLSERECSIQRRHQKLIEESPSPFMTSELREKMGQAAVQAAQAVNYEGAGTVEFLVDKYRNFYFMEMNTRIQVEHPVTEEVINYDLIKEQILVAAGIPLSGKHYFPECHAMECRINAEDPLNNFRPSPGKILDLHKPGGHGVRVDTHVYAGYVIPPYYDSMIAKLIVSGRTREEVIVRMKRCLEEFIIEGVHTTIPLHLKIMDDKRFRDGQFDTSFMNDFSFKDLATV
jgi:acetyl-CoA carboxylase, biotin carboxylase subunit